MSKEAMKLALEALETITKVTHPHHKVTIRKPVNGHVVTIYPHKVASDAITTLKQALEQPEPEPVAWMDEEKKVIYWHNTHETDDYHGFKRTTPLYTSPPKREPLTDEEIALIVAECASSAHRHDDFSFARAIEAAHGIKGEA